MDFSSSDLEFFDFKNSSDEEIKEIQEILNGPGSNGCVELPWEISVSNNTVNDLPQSEGATGVDLALRTKSVEAVIDSDLNCAQSLAAQLPPPPSVETFVTLPTTVGPYQNAPYFVSRTIPYLRAYPPMGVPFFACPIPPGAGEASPYGQFVPVTTEKPEARNESFLNTTQSNRQAEKRPDLAEPCPEPTVPLVPLPPSTFAVAGYPAGLHTLPYPQMAGQAASPAMYYVPVFNHPYGGYLPSPPMIIPETAELDKCSSGATKIEDREKPSTELGSSGEAPTTDCKPFEEDSSNVQLDCQQEGTLPAKTELDTLPSSKPPSERSSPSYLQEAWNDSPTVPVDCPTVPVPHLCLQQTVASNHCQPETDVSQVPRNKVSEISTSQCLPKTEPSNKCPPEHVVRANVSDPSRCWADLFKGPREVNGIDRHPPRQRSTLKKDITNGKVYSMPVKH